MGIIKAAKLVHEYIRRDEDGKVEEIRRAVDGVDLDVERGEFIAILGHNGSGKSTLAKHINAILAPTEGTMWVGGMDTERGKRYLEYPADGRDGVPESGQPDHRQRGGRGRGLWPGKPGRAVAGNLGSGAGEPPGSGNAGIPAPFAQPVCPAARSSGWPSPVWWPCIRNVSCWMSPRPCWIPTAARKSFGRCGR